MLLDLPEDVENSILCLLALQDLAIARRTNKKLAGWKFGPNVTEIQLPPTYISLSTLVGYYTPEHVVHISILPAFLDGHLLAISHLFPQLASLDLSGCEQITDAAVLALAQGHLSSLNLWKCNKITDAAVIAVAQEHLSSLNLAGCTQITDAAVIAVAQEHLSSLNLKWCDKITDAAVIAVARGCPQLSELDLTRCKQITEDTYWKWL